MQSFFTQKTQKSLQTRQTFKHIIWMMSWSCLRINLIWFPFSVNWLKVIKQSRSKWNRCHVYPLLLSRSTTTSMATSLATMSWRRHSAWPSTITFQTFQSAGTKTRQKRQKDGKKKTQIDNFQIARVNVKVSRTSAMLHLSLSFGFLLFQIKLPFNRDKRVWGKEDLQFANKNNSRKVNSLVKETVLVLKTEKDWQVIK